MCGSHGAADLGDHTTGNVGPDLGRASCRSGRDVRCFQGLRVAALASWSTTSRAPYRLAGCCAGWRWALSGDFPLVAWGSVAIAGLSVLPVTSRRPSAQRTGSDDQARWMSYRAAGGTCRWRWRRPPSTVNKLARPWTSLGRSGAGAGSCSAGPVPAALDGSATRGGGDDLEGAFSGCTGIRGGRALLTCAPSWRLHPAAPGRTAVRPTSWPRR